MPALPPVPAATPTPSPSPPEPGTPIDSSTQLGDSPFDWISLIFDFVSNVSWPLLIAFSILLLTNRRVRTALSSGLDTLAGTFKSFKVAGVEFVLNDDQIQKTLGQNQINLSNPEVRDGKPEAGGRASPERQTAADPETRTDDPRIIALQSYNKLESVFALAYDELAGADRSDFTAPGNRKYSTSRRPINMSQLLTRLRENEVLFMPEQDTVNSLRRIRNEIAHNVASVEMSLDSAIAYEKQCDQLIDSITSRVQETLKGRSESTA